VAVAEGNKEIITLIGHRLREAATAEEEGPSPEAIERGLAQLSSIDEAEGSIPIAPTGPRPPEPQTVSSPEPPNQPLL
jgi:hypothetical protein